MGTVSTNISASLEVYRIAKANSLESAAQKAWKIALDNFQGITTTNAFKELSETELQEYIGDKGLNIANEDPVFEAILTWVTYDMENRKHKFEKLMQHVTLLHCSLSFLRDVAMQEPLMRSVSGLQRVAEALAAQATSQHSQLGTPRKVQHSKNSLVAICEDQCWMLREGESEWKNSPLTDKILPCSSICVAGDEVIVSGGWSLELLFSRHCYKLSLSTLEWTAVRVLHVARRSHASVCVGGQVYVLGGEGDSGKLQSVEYLYEKTRSWRVTTDMPIALHAHTAVSYKHYIYVLGGFTELCFPSSASFVLDTVTHQWSRLANIRQKCYGCIAAASVVYRDRIYVLGGYHNCYVSYNADQNKWKTHSPPKEAELFDAFRSAVVWGDRMLLCRNEDGSTVIAEYNPDTDSWTKWNHSLPAEFCDAVFGVQL